MKRIYLDYAALTPIDPRVVRVMKRFSSANYANPSSLHMEGVAAKKALHDARTSVAAGIAAHADEIVFTSGGTEANGLALEGAGRAAFRAGNSKPHIIISAIEHASIMETAAMLERHGTEVTRVGVDGNGVINLDELKKAIKPSTFMVSIMTVNNETGVVQPIKEIAKIVRQARVNGSRYPLLHTDAAQALLYEDVNVEKLAVDLLTMDGSKVCGPRGIGALYIKRGTPIETLIYGGGQEKGMRSGTENLPSICGFAEGLQIVAKQRRKEGKKEKIAQLKDYFINELKRMRPGITINGPTDERSSPHVVNVSIPGIDNEFFLFQLDARGIACSTKSSCLRDEDESYVLKAMGADSKTSVRFSFGRWTRKGDLTKALKAIRSILDTSNAR